MWGHRLWMWHLPLDEACSAEVELSRFGVRVHLPAPLGHSWRELTRHAALAVAADAELDAADHEAQALRLGPWLPREMAARSRYPAKIVALRTLAADLRAAVSLIDEAAPFPRTVGAERAFGVTAKDRGG